MGLFSRKKKKVEGAMTNAEDTERKEAMGPVIIFWPASHCDGP